MSLLECHQSIAKSSSHQGFKFYSDGAFDYNSDSPDQECRIAYFKKTDVMQMSL